MNGLYQISNYERIKTLDKRIDKNHHVYEKLLKPQLNNNNYLTIRLSKNNKGKWCSYSHNLKEAYRLKLKTPTTKTRKKIIQYNLLGEKIKTWDSISIAAQELGIDNSNITKACIGKRSQCGGFVWRYFNE